MAKGRNSRPEEVQKDKKVRKHIDNPPEWMMKFGDPTFKDERISNLSKPKKTLLQKILS